MGRGALRSTLILLPLSLFSVLCSTHCSPVNTILPNSRTLDGYPLRQNWSATSYNNIITTIITTTGTTTTAVLLLLY